MEDWHAGEEIAYLIGSQQCHNQPDKPSLCPALPAHAAVGRALQNGHQGSKLHTVSNAAVINSQAGCMQVKAGICTTDDD